MQKPYISYASILCIALVAILGGCKKKSSDQSKKSFFSKVKDKSSSELKTVSDEAVGEFNLDDDEMKTFALDDNLSQHSSTTEQSNTLGRLSPTSQNNLFSWEQLAADENKQEFKRLFFLFNHYVLEPNQMKDLKYDIKQAKKMIAEGKTLVIEGHACHSEGSAAYNLALSEKRARHVAKHFAKAGIDPAIIKIAPRGQEMPLRRGGNREEQAINRRVEIFAIDK